MATYANMLDEMSSDITSALDTIKNIINQGECNANFNNDMWGNNEGVYYRLKMSRDICAYVAKYFFQESSNVLKTGYKKTAIELIKNAVRLLRYVHYKALPTNRIILSGKWQSYWFNAGTPSIHSGGIQMYNQVLQKIDNVKTIAYNIAGKDGTTSNIEAFVSSSSVTDTAKMMKITSSTTKLNLDDYAIKILNSVVITGAPTLKKLITDTANRLTSFYNSQTGNSYLQYGYLSFKDALSQSIDNINTFIASSKGMLKAMGDYKKLKNMPTANDQLHALALIQGSIENADTLLSDISSQLSTIPANDEAFLFQENTSVNNDFQRYPIRCWMNLRIISVLVYDLQLRMANVERAVDKIQIIVHTDVNKATTKNVKKLNDNLKAVNRRYSTLTKITNNLQEKLNSLSGSGSTSSSGSSSGSGSSGSGSSSSSSSSSVTYNLTPYISTIRSAIYGKDMREAIAKAFEIINKSLGTKYTTVVRLANINAWNKINASQRLSANYLYLIGKDTLMFMGNKYTFYDPVANVTANMPGGNMVRQLYNISEAIKYKSVLDASEIASLSSLSP